MMVLVFCHPQDVLSGPFGTSTRFVRTSSGFVVPRRATQLSEKMRSGPTKTKPGPRFTAGSPQIIEAFEAFLSEQKMMKTWAILFISALVYTQALATAGAPLSIASRTSFRLSAKFPVLFCFLLYGCLRMSDMRAGCRHDRFISMLLDVFALDILWNNYFSFRFAVITPEQAADLETVLGDNFELLVFNFFLLCFLYRRVHIFFLVFETVIFPKSCFPIFHLQVRLPCE